MKKLLCLALVIALLIPNVIVAQAANSSVNDELKIITSQEYGYTYTEYTDENYQTIRTYKKDSPVLEKTSSNARNVGGAELSLSQDATKALLSSLGMEDAFISKLSEEDLLEYANSSEIMAVTSYTKKDVEGNVVNVSKQEALDAVDSRAIVPAPDPGGFPSYDTTYADSYMYIAYVVSKRGNGRYKFSVDATWLTKPVFRRKDSLGACAQNMTVENNTRSGWISYDRTVSSTYGGYSTDHIESNLVPGSNGVSFNNAVNGNWYGSAAMFDLPNDIITSQYFTVYENFCVHYEYYGVVAYPNQQMNFNTMASYCHITAGIDVSLSIGISLSGPSLGIGFNGYADTDMRTAEFDTSITYIP